MTPETGIAVREQTIRASFAALSDLYAALAALRAGPNTYALFSEGPLKSIADIQKQIAEEFGAIERAKLRERDDTVRAILLEAHTYLDTPSITLPFAPMKYAGHTATHFVAKSYWDETRWRLTTYIDALFRVTTTGEWYRLNGSNWDPISAEEAKDAIAFPTSSDLKYRVSNAALSL